MTIAPFIGKFWVVEGLSPDLQHKTLVAIGTSRDELIDFIGNLDPRYRQFFIAFNMMEVGGTLEAIDEMAKSPTHPSTEARN